MDKKLLAVFSFLLFVILLFDNIQIYYPVLSAMKFFNIFLVASIFLHFSIDD